MSLSSIAAAAEGIEDRFVHKRVLFIPSESYCAATITVIQGLRELGFRVMTPYKPNINSWSWDDCVIGAENFRENLPVDFVISNLHWGTPWSLYERFGVQDHFKVLIDGDDSRHGESWIDRYDGWREVYSRNPRPQDDVCLDLQQPYRWMEPLGNYKPDLVFSAQKSRRDGGSLYIPLGIHSEFPVHTDLSAERGIAVTNIPGDGPSRINLTNFISRNAQNMPSPVHNETVKGEWCRPFWAIDDQTFYDLAATDPNVHSWHRWRIYPEYLNILANSAILIYPGVFDDIPQYQSRREFEAMAAGCLVLFKRPNIDMSDYDYLEGFSSLVWRDYDELMSMLRFFRDKTLIANKMTVRLRRMAMRYLTPEPIARYVLAEVSKRI